MVISGYGVLCQCEYVCECMQRANETNGCQHLCSHATIHRKIRRCHTIEELGVHAAFEPDTPTTLFLTLQTVTV